MRASNQEPLAVQLERPTCDELEIAQPKALNDADLAVGAGQHHLAAIQRWMRRRPQLWAFDGKRGELGLSLPRGHGLLCAVNRSAFWIDHPDRNFHRI